MQDVSAMARSPESKRLLDFVLENNIPINWEDASHIKAFASGRTFDSVPTCKLDKPFTLTLFSDTNEWCEISLGLVLALATEYIRQQREVVEKVIKDKTDKDE